MCLDVKVDYLEETKKFHQIRWWFSLAIIKGRIFLLERKVADGRPASVASDAESREV